MTENNIAVSGFPNINVKPFGKTPGGTEVMLYTLTNQNGLRVEITNYGGLIVRLFTPDRNGQLNDIVLGYNKLEDYIEKSPYFGALIGRYGNRIANGEFSLDGVTYRLAQNSESGGISCHLHGGIKTFDKVVWEADPRIVDGSPGLMLHYLSKDGEEGYPGNLDVTVYYWLTNDNILKVEYQAFTDKATPVNLTQHSYFNLKGEGNGNVLGHILTINADKITPVDRGLIPTGEYQSVKDTPFDFNNPTEIGKHINDNDQQLAFGDGYDHNYVLNNEKGEVKLAARVFEPLSGRQMEVWTTEPGMQFYSGNSLDKGFVGKSGRMYSKQSGFCLETQHYPDSPNQSHFPSTILRPGEKYQTETKFVFSVK